MDVRKSVRGQSGAELMIVYAFVILSIGVAFILLYNMGAFTSMFDRVCEKDALGFPLLVPVDWGVFYSNNDIQANMRNDAGMTIEVTSAFASLGAGVNCSWSPGLGPKVFLGPGDSVTFNLTCLPTPIQDKLNAGDCFAANAVFNYTNVENGRTWKSIGTLRGEIEKSR